MFICGGGSNSFTNGKDGVFFKFDAGDTLMGIPATHGTRVFLGYFMDGVYANYENEGLLPTPDSLWFDPIRHLTLDGKLYLDSALYLATAECTPPPEICGNGFDDDGDGLVDCDDVDCLTGPGCGGSCEGNNTGFENGFIGWTNDNGISTTSDAYEGIAAADITDGAEISQVITGIEPDSTYFLSFWVKASGNITTLWAAVVQQDASGNDIGETNVNPAASSDWQLYTMTFTATANTDRLLIRFSGYGTGISYKLDEVCLKKLPGYLPPVTCTGCPVYSSYEDAASIVGLNYDPGWAEFQVDSDMELCHNADGTITIQGNLLNPSLSGGATSCGLTDGWFIDITLSNKETWAEFGGSYSIESVTSQGCNDNHADWDYWDVTGTLTGTGCSSGKVFPITGSAPGYKVQVGYAANNYSCDFAIAGWLEYVDNGVVHAMDIYFEVDEDCYYLPEVCTDGIDNDGDGLVDCDDPDCKQISITELTFFNCNLRNDYLATMSVEVSWSSAPAGENIILTTNDTVHTIDIVGGATSPTTVDIIVKADNSLDNPIDLVFSGGNGCGFSSTYNAPAPCPPPSQRNKLCDNRSGYVGGQVFNDFNANGFSETGEYGIEGILVTATDSTGATVGQTSTNNLGVFQFTNLTDGTKIRLEYTSIPTGMYPTNGSTYKGTTVQFVETPACVASLGLVSPAENPCTGTNNSILQNGYSVVGCLPAGDNVTLAIKDITQLGTLWQTPANRNNNQSANVPTIQMWETGDFEGGRSLFRCYRF